MEEKDYLSIAKEYSIKEWNFDIVLYAGEEDGWRYFSCTREGRPKWSSLPTSLRISKDGDIEEVGGFDIRLKISNMAHSLDNANESKRTL